ncbi:hypothetical protein MTJW_22190 [Moorella thermoacetica]|nr:hypothetical protein MTJW_22190 [Moorella thermoacetica]
MRNLFIKCLQIGSQINYGSYLKDIKVIYRNCDNKSISKDAYWGNEAIYLEEDRWFFYELITSL